MIEFSDEQRSDLFIEVLEEFASIFLLFIICKSLGTALLNSVTGKLEPISSDFASSTQRTDP